LVRRLARDEWFVWLKRNFKKDGKPLSESTASRYMQLAETFKESRGARAAGREFPTLSSFTHPNRESHHQPDWHKLSGKASIRSTSTGWPTTLTPLLLTKKKRKLRLRRVSPTSTNSYAPHWRALKSQMTKTTNEPTNIWL
jgi:hypothetical protein